MKHRFSEKFEAQLIAAMNGAAPWRSQMEKPHAPIGPSEKQVYWLKKYKVDIPATKVEATAILSELFGR